MLPKPALSFTIPSIHDDIPLDCRIYHPTCLHGAGPGAAGSSAKGVEMLRKRDALGRKIWRKKAAVVAHPYAPLGGCYDDPVVSEAAEVLLGEGWIVGTFNFRGAFGSKGTTSWTAKPELEDYKSFVGFMSYYMHNLQAPTPSITHQPVRVEDDTEEENAHENDDKEDSSDTANSHLLLLAGYSYGSLISINLPSTNTILETHFHTPESGSAAHDIRLRAQHLATQQNDVWRFVLMTSEAEVNDARGRQPKESHRAIHGRGLRMGGEESIESMRRASRDSRRSIDSTRIRRSLERVRSIGKHHGGSARPESSPAPTSPLASTRPLSRDSDSSLKNAKEGLEMRESEGLASTRTCYLLISPLQGMIRSLVFMSFLEKVRTRDQVLAKEEYKKLVFPNSTLAVYGDQDGFSNLKKQRSWMELLGPETDQPLELGFKSREVKGAGHFWRERGVMRQMREYILEWLQALQK